MALPKGAHDFAGKWTGRSKLHLSWLESDLRVQESDSSLSLELNKQGAYLVLSYDWTYEGEVKEGVLIIAGESEGSGVQMAWVDSWHQSGGVLHLEGSTSEEGVVKAKGSYSAGEETWGWTIALWLEGDQLSLKMENVTPGGDAEWAVMGVYSRA